jgi:hypothetical protein
MKLATVVTLGLLVPRLVLGQDGAPRAAATITAAEVAARVGLLAHDSMRGRDTPSRELDRAATYIAAEFARMGLRPGGDEGSFIQRYPLERRVPDTAGSYLALGTEVPIRFGADAIRVEGPYVPAGVSGSVVLVTGSTAAGTERMDLAGAIVVAILPTDGTGQPSAGSTRLFRALAGRRPAAIVLPVDSPGDVWREVVRLSFRSTLGPVWSDEDGVPVVMVRDRAIAEPLARAGVDLATARRAGGAPTARPVSDVRATLVVRALGLDPTTAPNVVAFLPGGDPRLRDEVVVISAHMDHVGVAGSGRCRPIAGDTICNGADDNASGTTAVLEIAEALAAQTPRPRRSFLFLTVSGEEHGLWGSDYFTGHPPVPVERMVADLNLDMVGRNWKDTIVAIGREHSDLGETLARVERAHPELGMTAVSDLWPAERFYFRSDHYNLARRGVPILFFFNGTHADYHRPGDEPSKIDAEKEARIARLVFYLGLEIANAPERPRWKPESYREIVTDGN